MFITNVTIFWTYLVLISFIINAPATIIIINAPATIIIINANVIILFFRAEVKQNPQFSFIRRAKKLNSSLYNLY